MGLVEKVKVFGFNLNFILFLQLLGLLVARKHPT
jgi:hypothetical protein